MRLKLGQLSVALNQFMHKSSFLVKDPVLFERKGPVFLFVASMLAVGRRATKTATNEVAAVWAGFLVVGAGHAQGQLHSTRTTAGSVWSAS